MGSKEDLIALEQKFCARNYNRLPVVLSRGKDVWVWDTEGNKYLDMLACYSAQNFGYGHPKIEKVFIKQVKRLSSPSGAFYNDQLGPFCKELAGLCEMDMVLPMNTGVEAVETAIKAVRRWGYFVKGVDNDKAEIVVCDYGFHGRTITVVGFSSHQEYRDGFGPFTPGFVSVPFDDLGSLEAVMNPNTVAVLLEPIQGEGGINIPKRGYLRGVREMCTRHNTLLVLDEIQTGLGRTGKIFACDYERIRPDVFILAKALGGGLSQVSAVVSSRDVLGLLGPGSHGSTFGGNPLASAVGREAIRVLVNEKLAENSLKMGNYFLRRLEALARSSPLIKEVRGKGLMIGMEFTEGSLTARSFCERLLKEGILTKETHETVVRFTPPLTIKKKHIDWACERIKKVLTNV